jgi:hypothetical protein
MQIDPPLKTPLDPPLSGGKTRPQTEGWSGKAAQNRARRKRLSNLEKPAVASLLEINITMTSSTFNHTRYCGNESNGESPGEHCRKNRGEFNLHPTTREFSRWVCNASRHSGK